MVVQVSKELDVVRIGIDRYSLKTGCNLRAVMDMSVRVIKEPRGFIRIIQCVLAILAFSTTAGFSTECEFSLDCASEEIEKEIVKYEVDYPFTPTTMNIYYNCESDKKVDLPLQYDFSSSSEFFVATGVVSFLYTIGILIVYIFFHQTYTENTKVPIIDMGVTAILSIFWLAGSSAWAQGVVDLKHYLHPETVINSQAICHTTSGNKCEVMEDGSYGVLNASLILGFANFVLWTCSLWFVYKETVFHSTEVVSDPSQNQASKPGMGRV